MDLGLGLNRESKMAERVGVGDCNVGKGQVQVSKDGDSGLVVLQTCAEGKRALQVGL